MVAAAKLRATLTDDGCTYEGDTSPAAGRFTIDFANKTKFFAAVALARLSDGKTINDLQPYLEKARPRSRILRAGRPLGRRGRTEKLLAVDLPAGRYALMCFAYNLPMSDVYRAALL